MEKKIKKWTKILAFIVGASILWQQGYEYFDNKAKEKLVTEKIPASFLLSMRSKDAKVLNIENSIEYRVADKSSKKIVLTCLRVSGNIFWGSNTFESKLVFNPQKLTGRLRVDETRGDPPIKTAEVLMSRNGQGYDVMFTYDLDKSVAKGKLIPLLP